MNYTSINILDLMRNETPDNLQEILEEFSSPINPEVSSFLKQSAVDFAKKYQSITYLVFGAYDELAGYFTITFRQISINCARLSRTQKKRFARFGKFDDGSEICQVPAFLIAQLGKNFSEVKITGTSLLSLAIEKINEVRHQIGGGVVFLEAEDHAKLLDFYQRPENGFIPFDERTAADGTKLIQLYRFL